MASHNRAWFREHKNGATVVILEWNDGAISGGIYRPQNGLRGIESNVAGSLEQAKSSLDGKSGCPQPCPCPAWHANG